MSNYKGILTNKGKELLANATMGNRVNFSHLALGDGNGSTPTLSETRTALIKERHRLTLNSVDINPNNRNQIVCETIIPTNIGGFTVRELGLYAGSHLVMHSTYPPTYKPRQDEGGAREMVVRVVINVQNADVVALYLDTSLVYATREWVETNFINHNEVIDNLGSNDANKPLSAAQGKNLQNSKLDKTANAVSATKLHTARTVSFSGAATGSFNYDGTANSTCTLTLVNSGVVANTYGNNITIPVITVNNKGLVTGISTQDIRAATTTTAGIVQLNDTLTSSATNLALTAHQGKVLKGQIDSKLASNANAVSATKLHTSRTINGTVFDGTTNITVGLPTFSTTINQAQTLLNNANDAISQGGFTVRHLSSTTTNKPDGISHAMMSCVYDGKYASQIATDWRTNKLYSRTLNNGQWTNWQEVAYVSSNVASSNKLHTPRTLSMTGDGTWSVSFDGHQNVSGAFTLANSGVKAGSYNSVTVDAKGRVIAGLTQTHGLITATSTTGTTNTATNNANTFLNIVATGVGSASAVGSSTQITGTHGITVSSDTAGKLIISQAFANNLTDTSTTKALTANMGKVLKDELTALDGRKFEQRGILGLTDLNTLTATNHAGIWHQAGDINATPERNYPVRQAGTLWVLPSAYAGQQLYLPYRMGQFYTRTTQANGGWTDWIAIGETINTLNNTSTTAALSAAQGKILKEQIDTKLASHANAVSASKLQTPRQISLSGAVTGSVNFDGSGNVIITTTLTKAVVREYNRTINGTATGQTTNSMPLVGQVVVGSDGRITQYFHLKHFRDFWFGRDDEALGYQNSSIAAFKIPLALWTAMPNKILSVTAQTMRSSNATSSAQYSSEASEQEVAWSLRSQSDRSNIWLNLARMHGGSSEHIDLFVVVEGY